MTNTTDRPISVDGVRLDTLAWNIEKVTRGTADRRSGDYSVPGMDGVIPSVNDPLETASYGLDMWLRGSDADGAVPAAGARDTLRANLDELLHLFGKRHALLDVQEQVSAASTRRAWCKIDGVIQPDLNLTGSAARFTVNLVIPSGSWEDVTTQDWTGAAGTASGVTQTVATMTGATERSSDNIYLVTGPANTPRITDPSTGMWVELGVNLAAGQTWRFNSLTWSSRYGAAPTLGTSDTTGTDGTALTNVGGPSRAAGLPLVPVRSSGSRVCQVALSGGGFTAATNLAIRGKREYAA